MQNDLPSGRQFPESFIDNTPCGFLSFTDNGNVLLVNKYLLDLLGYEHDEVISKHVDRLFSVAGRIFYQTHFFPLLKLQSRVDEIYLSLKPKNGGEIPMLVSASRHEEDGSFVNNCVLLSMRERHKMEQELITARRAAEDAMRAKDEFLAVASHELRTPLTAMLGWLHLLKETDRDTAMLDEALEVIERNANLQAQLVSDILDISRIATGKLQINVEAVNVVAVLREAVDVIRPALAAKNITIDEKIDITAGAISGDPARLQQIFWNLLSNAAKFTPRQGNVEVRLSRVGSSVAVTISDNGEGIPADFLPFVFDRFRQADQAKSRKHGGLGLGLSIVRELVELHGGTIKAMSEGPGKGATFEVRFPVRSIELDIPLSHPTLPFHTPDEEYLVAAESRLDGIKILLVDDSKDSLHVISKILENYGAQVTTATNATAALGQMESDRPSILVSDIEMPDNDGIWLMERLRQHPLLKDLPAIALTAHASGADEDIAINAGYQQRLTKPIKPADLVQSILEVKGGY
jgi:PAS domain S-box-containing protein